MKIAVSSTVDIVSIELSVQFSSEAVEHLTSLSQFCPEFSPVDHLSADLASAIARLLPEVECTVSGCLSNTLESSLQAARCEIDLPPGYTFTPLNPKSTDTDQKQNIDQDS